MRNQEFFVVEMIGVKRFFYADLAVWLAFPCVVFAIWCADCDLLIGDSWTAFRVQCVLNAIAAVLGIAMLTLRYRETGRTFWNRAALGLSAAGITLLLLSWNFLCLFLDEGQEYHSFSSPDGSHTVVVMERVSLIAGDVTLYERINPFLIQFKGSMTTDDGYRPVCAGDFSLFWEGDSVRLIAGDGMGGEATVSVGLGRE